MLIVFSSYPILLDELPPSSTRSFASCQEYKLVPMIRSRTHFFLLLLI